MLDALPAYEELKQRADLARASPEQQLELLPGELEHVLKLLRHFQHSAAVKDQALGLYVNAKVGSPGILSCMYAVLSSRDPHSVLGKHLSFINHSLLSGLGTDAPVRIIAQPVSRIDFQSSALV